MGTTNLGLPVGTVTFLFTDIEGSTEILQAHPNDYEQILERYRQILEEEIGRCGGWVVDHAGDGLFAAFERAADAIRAAVAIRRSLARERWPGELRLRVRMGIHTGEPRLSAGGYVGIDVHRAARIASAAHGGQILCSASTSELLEPEGFEGIALRDLGRHRLKDLRRPQRLYQVDSSDHTEEFPPVRSLEGHKHNLPFQVNEIIGRERDTRTHRQSLEESRLLTLVGPGGIGKTRLALDVAAGVIDRYRDGVWYVELAPLTDPELLGQVIGAVVGVREHSDSQIEELLFDYLKDRELLLVLDNCEHLIDACAVLTERLLRYCGEVRILATSREAFGISGELVRRVPPLGVPVSGELEEVGRSESVRLFVERARAAADSLDLTEENAPVLAEICRRLDGIPLAVELAASRTRLLSVEEIARGLDDRFRLLTGGSRTALPRQQTLKALIDWSYELLSEKERVMLRRLSVFCCTWPLSAAERICVDKAGVGDIGPDDLLGLVAALVDKSLVAVEHGAVETRYRLLETIRHYAQEKLLSCGESQQLRDRHLHYFLGIAEQADARLRGAEQKEWLSLLDAHEDELRSALGWAGGRGMVEELERLATSLWRYWRVRSKFGEGRRWLEEALTMSADMDDGAEREQVVLRTRCLIGAGSLANYQGDYLRAAEVLSEGLRLSRAIGDLPSVADSLTILAHARLMTGEEDRAADMLRESLEIFSKLGRKRGIAYAKYCLGSLMVRRGEYSDARDNLVEGLSLMEELEDTWWIENTLLELGWANGRLGDQAGALRALRRAQAIAESFSDRRGAARALMHVAGVELSGKQFDAAGRSYRESLELFSTIGDRWGIVSCIEGVAAAAASTGKGKEAVRLIGAAARARESLKSTVRTLDFGEHENLLDVTKRSLGDDEFDRLFEEGYRLSFQAAVERALAFGL